MRAEKIDRAALKDRTNVFLGESFFLFGLFYSGESRACRREESFSETVERTPVFGTKFDGVCAGGGRRKESWRRRKNEKKGTRM